MSTKILRPRKVAERVGYSTRQIRRLDDAGKFPKPVRLNRAVGFVEAEVEAWLQGRIEASRAPTAGAVTSAAA